MAGGRPRLARATVLIGVLVVAGMPYTGAPARAAAPDDPGRPVIVELAGEPAIRTMSVAGGRPDALAVGRLVAARNTLSAAQRDVVGRARQAGVRVQGERSLTLLVDAVSMRVPERGLPALRPAGGGRGWGPRGGPGPPGPGGRGGAGAARPRRYAPASIRASR